MNQYKPMLPYLGVAAAAFYLLPLLMKDTGLAMLMLLIIIPAVCLLDGLFYGRKHGFQLMFPIACGILFVPTVWIYYNSSASIYIMSFTSFTMAGTYFGSLMRKK